MDNTRDLTPDEQTIVRINPGTNLISEPVTSIGGQKIYFAANDNGRIIMQVINACDGGGRSPIFLTQSEVENILPCVLGNFLTQVRDGQTDPRLTRTNADRKKRIKEAAAVNPDQLEGEK